MTEKEIETAATPISKEELVNAFDNIPKEEAKEEAKEGVGHLITDSPHLPEFNHKIETMGDLEIPQVQKDILLLNWKIEMQMERQEHIYEKNTADYQSIKRDLVEIKSDVGIIKTDAMQWIYRIVIFILALSAFLAALERFLGM